MYVCVSAACIRLTEAMDALKLELQIVVSCCVGSGNQTKVLWKSTPSHFHKGSISLLGLPRSPDFPVIYCLYFDVYP